MENDVLYNRVMNVVHEEYGPPGEGTKEITITENGTTTEDVRSYASAEITVTVPNSYTESDEGKVVDSGALVSQSSATYTENDTYDTTLINEVTVNVSGGSIVPPLYPLGYYFNSINTAYLWVSGDTGHVTFKKDTTANTAFYLNLFALEATSSVNAINNQPSRFTIEAGSEVNIKVKNVINPDSLVWNMNFKQANSTTSLGYAIGNGTHVNGENITVTSVADEEIGTLFVYVSAINTTGTLEFDVEITVDGVRYL